MLVKGAQAVNYVNNFKYCHFHLYIYFITCFCPLLKFMIETHVITTIYTLPSTNLTLVKKGVLYSGSKIYNHLLLNIKALSKGAKQFKSKLRSYLIKHTFYNLEEYYQLTI